MKKSIILGLLALPILASAQISNPPADVKFIKNMFGIKISPNGEWIASEAGDAMVYNVKTGQSYTYEGYFLGDHHAVANNGMAVGNSESFLGTIYSEGEVTSPRSFLLNGVQVVNSITPDGSVITGYCSNRNSSTEGISFLPFIGYVNSPTDVEIVIPDYPKRDFFGGPPVYILGFALSDDGKTMVGTVTDFRGMYTYPIVFKEESHGQWNYSLPSESLFNPTHIDIPLNPEFNEPVFPEPADYMSGFKKIAYQTAYEQFSQGLADEPDPLEYMTEEEMVSYLNALDFWMKWAKDNEAAVQEYFKLYQQVLRTTPSFGHNQSAISPDGKFMVIPGGAEDENDEVNNNLYKFNCDGSGYVKYAMPTGSLFPTQVLTSGDVVLTSPPDQSPNTYIMTAGGYKFTKFSDLLKTDYPQIANWVTSNFSANGQVCFSDDMSVASGAVTYYIANMEEKYATYIIQNLKVSGVEEIAEELGFDGVYKVYNLQGVKVLETKDAGEINALGKGIYIINGKKVYLR